MRILSAMPVFAILAMAPTVVMAEKVQELTEITVSGSQEDTATASSLGMNTTDDKGVAAQQSTTSDSARLLQDIPGVTLNSAGGISSLPAIHGLSDDRIRIQVDGMDLTASCPNHMNSVLSYIEPAKVASVKVFSGVTPVSVGGDSIGGSIQVQSAPPEFAGEEEDASVKGHAGSYFRSNGNAYGYNFGATVVGRLFNVSYSESNARSDNYSAGKSFKRAAQGQEGGPLIPGDEVGSSSYDGARYRELGLALRHEGHTLQAKLGQQTVGFEGFPNQRMDMTYNKNTLLNIHYTGRLQWGDLEARFFHQDTRHRMDMGPDRYYYGTGMPMYTKGETTGGQVQGNILISDQDTLRVGVEYQRYTLYDWWPPVGGTMGPDTFWNIDYGQRDKLDTFAEWESRWSPEWLGLIGVRSDIVRTDAAAVQGYNDSLAGTWGNDALAFNLRPHDRIDYNWDVTGMVRHTPAATQLYETGYSRKTRSPNLYQRYPWSTNPMAALMNNLVGDGNGYIGNLDLKPEVANTFSLTGDWHDPDKKIWSLRATGYYTYVQDYIDARRCGFSQCSPVNLVARNSFVLLQYVNQNAQLYGADISGQLLLGESADYGSFTGSALAGYVRGENLTTGDNLYNIMPLNGKLAVSHRLGGWNTTVEAVAAANKHLISQVRNEIQTGGYCLFNLHSSYEWKQLRLDFGVANIFNRFYSMPLGGAYVGQGASMTTNGIPWGTAVPGPGRSFNVAVKITF